MLIKIKLGLHYTRAEIRAFIDATEAGLANLEKSCGHATSDAGHYTDCGTCENRKICKAFTSALDYLDDIATLPDHQFYR